MSVSVADQGVIFPRREYALETFPGLSTTHLYLAPSNANADDNNPGNDPDMPLATLNGVIERLNLLARITSAVIVHMESGTYTWGVTLGPIALSAPLAFYGDGGGQDGDDGFVEITSAAAAAAGTGQRVVVDPVGGITVNSLVGKTILILTGAAAGDRRTIHSNTATNILPVRAFTAAVAVGDSFRIVESGAVITAASAPSIAASPPSIAGVGTPADVFGLDSNIVAGVSPHTLLLSNLILEKPVGDLLASTFWIAGSAVALAGVELQGTIFGVACDENSFVQAGCDIASSVLNEFVLPNLLGLASSRTEWAGWGLHVADTAGLPTFKRFSGFLTQLTTSYGAITRGCQWQLLGGHLVGSFGGAAGTDFNGFWAIARSQIRIDAFDSLLPFSVTAVGAHARAAGIRVISGSILDASGLAVVITVLGSGIVATGSESDSMRPLQAGTVSLHDGNTISAPYACVIAMTGGRIYWNDDPVAVVVPTAGEAIITQSATNGAAVAPSPTTFAGLADGAVVVNPDGSGTILGRIT